jgi:hypothetical protein
MYMWSDCTFGLCSSRRDFFELSCACLPPVAAVLGPGWGCFV